MGNNRKRLKVKYIDGEIWKDIVGFEGLYQVSNKQRVKSVCRISLTGFKIPEKILRPGKHKFGYLKYTLCREGKLHYKQLHILIAEVFIPNPNNYPFVNHIDSNPMNNSIENLEWCTASHNTKHAYKSGRISKTGESNHMSKLSEIDVIDIFNSKDNSKIVADHYGVSRQTVSDIRAKRRWKKLLENYRPVFNP